MLDNLCSQKQWENLALAFFRGKIGNVATMVVGGWKYRIWNEACFLPSFSDMAHPQHGL